MQPDRQDELIVIALGGNALLRRGEAPSAANHRANVAHAADVIVDLVRGRQAVVTHGNGPQIGLLALAEGEGSTLDVLDAQTEGWIGYLLEQALDQRLEGRSIATLLTRVEVDADDPGFDLATKPIGPMYDEATAARVAKDHSWSVGPDGAGWRRRVASPEPQRIVELETIRLLAERDVLVIAVGGGGIPVIIDGKGERGVEAVIDKDLSSALLAIGLDADRLVLLTDAAAVYDRWGEPGERRIDRATVAELRDVSFEPGSMGPKVEAACRFVEATGRTAHIGGLETADGLLAGVTGTTVVAH